MTDEVTVPVALLHRIAAGGPYTPEDWQALKSLLQPEPAPVPEWLTKPGAMAALEGLAYQRSDVGWASVGGRFRADAEMVERGAVQLVPAVPVEKPVRINAPVYRGFGVEYASGWNACLDQWPDDGWCGQPHKNLGDRAAPLCGDETCTNYSCTQAALDAHFARQEATARSIVRGALGLPDALAQPDPSRLPDGEWRCIKDNRTEPCGECSGCREVQDINALAQEPAACCRPSDPDALPCAWPNTDCWMNGPAQEPKGDTP